MNERAKTESEATVQARARAERLAGAFREVFGYERERSTSQKLVLEHLSTCAGDDANSYRFNEAKDGLALIAAGVHRDGARSLLRIIERQLAISEKSGSKRPKPATIR
jgi:hypothetical protein